MSISYNVKAPPVLHFEWITDGTRCALEKPDEVARNGAFQGRLRPEVFL